mgnify:CR=1 FL=1
MRKGSRLLDDAVVNKRRAGDTWTRHRPHTPQPFVAVRSANMNGRGRLERLGFHFPNPAIHACPDALGAPEIVALLSCSPATNHVAENDYHKRHNTHMYIRCQLARDVVSPLVL